MPEESQRICATCGTPGTGRFCANCGAPLPEPAEPVGLDVLFTHQDDAEATVYVPPTALPPGRVPTYPDDRPTDRLSAVPAAIGAAAVVRPVRAPGPNRTRRRAIWAVAGVATVTVVVLLIALVVAPSFSGGKNNADTSTTAAPPSTSSSAPGSSDSSVSVLPPDPSTPASTAPASTAPATTTTATASSAPPRTTVTSGTTTVTSKTTPSTTRTTPKTTTTTKKTTAATSPLGVPAAQISCGRGFVVQVASELSAQAFTARVATLKGAGQLPDNSKAADTSKSCNIFSGQVNTIVLWTGPYPQPYDGCSARLAAPADAFIRSTDPSDPHAYVSCLCPAKVAELPTISKVGQQDVWVGELQRVLANRLSISIPDLGDNWGTYSAGTKAAVQKFQIGARLQGTGVVDRKTWVALQAAQDC